MYGDMDILDVQYFETLVIMTISASFVIRRGICAHE